jgi:hypothetical protein
MLPVETYEEEAVEIEPLSAKENKRRADLEAVIEKSFKGFVEVGLALKEIRESKLYRSTHALFANYCADLWELNERHAQRQIASADVIKNLENQANCSENPTHGSGFDESDLLDYGNILPTNERQTRPLTRLKSEQQRIVWAQVVNNAQIEDRKVTAGMVEQCVREFLGEKKTERRKELQRRMAKASRMDYEVKRYFRDFFQVIDDAKHEGWKKTSKEAVIKYLDELKRVVLEA